MHIGIVGAQPQEVVPGIFVVKQAITFKKENFPVNMYVIAGKDGMVFDSGFGTSRAGRRLARHIRQISDVFAKRGQPCSIRRAMTSHGHWDHFSGLAYLQKALKIEIMATEKQADKIQFKKAYKKLFRAKSVIQNPHTPPFFKTLDDVRLNIFKEIYIKLLGIRFVSGPVCIVHENTTLSINDENWQLLYLPGHCDDDMALYNQPRGILISGDIVLKDITTWLGPVSSNLELYLDSLERIKNLPNLKLILPAHGNPITNPVERVQEAIEHRHKRTQSVFQKVLNSSEKGISFEEIFKTFYPRPRRIQRTMLGGWIIVTLEHLICTGQIFSSIRGREVVFKANLN